MEPLFCAVAATAKHKLRSRTRPQEKTRFISTPLAKSKLRVFRKASRAGRMYRQRAPLPPAAHHFHGISKTKKRIQRDPESMRGILIEDLHAVKRKINDILVRVSDYPI